MMMNQYGPVIIAQVLQELSQMLPMNPENYPLPRSTWTERQTAVNRVLFEECAGYILGNGKAEPNLSPWCLELVERACTQVDASTAPHSPDRCATVEAIEIGQILAP